MNTEEGGSLINLFQKFLASCLKAEEVANILCEQLRDFWKRTVSLLSTHKSHKLVMSIIIGLTSAVLYAVFKYVAMGISSHRRLPA